MRRALLVMLLWSAQLGGCSRSDDASPPRAEPPAAAVDKRTPVTEAPSTTSATEVEAPKVPAPTRRGESVEFSAGTLLLGSGPLTPYRDAALEADLVPVDVGAFSIDRLPYPNDPQAAPKTGVTRPEAAKLCADEGKHLCTEAQWERACKADANNVYPTGTTLDLEACVAAGHRCGNALGLMSMGIGAREWTASEWPQGFGNPLRTAVTRGAAAGGELAMYRCAARSGATEDSASESIGFRCCQAGAQQPRFNYPTEPRRRVVAPLEVELDALRAALATRRELAPLAGAFKLFDGADIARALARGDRNRGNITAWHIADSSFIWSPGAGQALWVFSGFSGERSVVAAFHAMPDGSLIHAASTVINEPDTSVALGYTEDRPTELLWTTCFGCAAEGGDLSVGEDGVVAFTYR